MIIPVNILAVIVATLASFFVGWLWYGPLFGKPWMKLRGLDPALMGTMGMPWGMMAGEFISTLITAYIIAEFVGWLGIVSYMGGIVLALWVWLGFYATTLMGPVFWEKTPIKLYAINASRWLVSLLAIAIILSVWH